MTKHVAWATSVGAIAISASTSFGAFQSNPYIDLAGTGANQTSNGGGASVVYDKSASTTVFTGPIVANTPFLYYAERFTAPTEISTVFLDSIRQMGGTIYVATSPTTVGGYVNEINTPVQNFNVGANAGKVVDVLRTGANAVYGIKVLVNQTTDNHYQLATAEFENKYTGPNVTPGAVQITSAGPTRPGSVIDGAYGPSSSWRANPALNGPTDEQFIGFEFAGGATKEVSSVRVVTFQEGGTSHRWTNFDVQIKQAGIWSTIGTAAIPSGQNIFWGDFGGLIPVQGVRLYGSTANGNNPASPALSGLIIDEIFAFGAVPEPGSAMALIGLSMLPLIRGRRRQKLGA